MNSEELKKITDYWKLSDTNVIADHAKLKAAFEATQAEIASFWNEVDALKNSDKSTGDQLRAILDMLRDRVQFLPIFSFEVDGSYTPAGGDFGGTTCGTVYNGPDTTVGYKLINDIDEQIWRYYFDRVQSVDDLWRLRDLCFPVGYNFWESKEKTNEANSKIPDFLDEADADTLANGFLIQEEHYRLSEEMPDVYSAVIDRFIDVIDVGQLGGFLADNAMQLRAMTDDQFLRLVEKAEAADPQAKQALRESLSRDSFGNPNPAIGADVGLDELMAEALNA